MLRFLIPAFAVMGALLVLFAGDIGDLGPIGVSERSNPFANRTAAQSNQLQKSEPQRLPPRAAAQVALQDQSEPLQQKVDELQQQESTLQHQLAKSSQALQKPDR